jgi:5-methylcytosine-specific restriction endonuclease McrA
MRQLRKRRPNLFKAIEKNRKRPADFRKKFNNYCKLWKKLNPDKRLASYQKRRAHTTMTIAAKQLSAMRTAQNGKCYYCQKPLDNRGRGHLEHKTPLSRGGEHALNNVCFACSTCNLKKGRRTEFEFLGLCIKTQ